MFDYSDKGDTKIADYSYLFDNFDPVNCPVTTCHVFEPGCKDIDTDQKVTTSGTPKTNINMVTKVTSGYIEAVCIKCENS